MAATSSADLVKRLGRAPAQTKAVLLAGVLGVMGFLYWYLMYAPASDELTAAVGQKKQLVDQERALLKRKSEFQETLRMVEDAEARVRANSVMLPASRELPAFYQHLETQAAASDVRLVDRKVDKEIAYETYVRVPVKMEVAGDFYQLTRYFRLLYDAKRIITIDDLSVSSPRRDGDRVILTAKFVASTFRQVEQKPEAAAATGAPAAGGAAAPAGAAAAPGATPSAAPPAATPPATGTTAKPAQPGAGGAK